LIVKPDRLLLIQPTAIRDADETLCRFHSRILNMARTKQQPIGQITSGIGQSEFALKTIGSPVAILAWRDHLTGLTSSPKTGCYSVNSKFSRLTDFDGSLHPEYCSRVEELILQHLG
jgi:hypothetical protein